MARTFIWENTGPDTVVWDGLTDSRELAPDGKYSFGLTSTDRAGNTFTFSVDGIELNTVETPVAVARDQQFISPNGDGVQDTVALDLTAEGEVDILSWEVVVYDDSGSPARTYSGAANPPDQVVFDGKDDGGDIVDQGDYRAVFSLAYRNGNNPNASASFHIDTTEPAITVDIDNRRFSPNDDGIRDTVSISLKSNEIVTWAGAITDSSGAVMLPIDSGKTTSLIVWYGDGPSGAIQEDGTYYFQADFTDRAGNTHTTPREGFVIDLTPPNVTFSVDKDYFSPDEDGIKDTLTASFTSDESVRGYLTILDSAGRDVGTLGGFGRAYQPISGSFEYVWNGISGSGLYIPDGTYGVKSVYEDLAGNRVTLSEATFTVDTRDVRVSLDAPKGFSPNGDGIKDIITIDVDALFFDSVESWKASYTDATGTVMHAQEGTGTLPSLLEWNGSMQYASDVTTPEGRYSVELDVTYMKGNVVSVSSNPFFVDITPPAVSLRATSDPFTKVGDSSMEGDLFITLQIEDAHDVADWSLDVLTPSNDIVRSFTGTGDLEDQVIWKGEGARVSQVPIAEWVVLRVSVVDEVGNETIFEQSVPLELLVVRRDGKLYLLVPNVIFGAYQHALDSRGDEMYQRNVASIQRVKQIFDKYPDYDLELEGHALNIYRGDVEREAAEEEVLVPLTKRRAHTVRDALVENGMDSGRIETNSYGGSQPIVDVHDPEERWKNRRVEFVMVRQ